MNAPCHIFCISDNQPQPFDRAPDIPNITDLGGEAHENRVADLGQKTNTICRLSNP